MAQLRQQRKGSGEQCQILIRDFGRVVTKKRGQQSATVHPWPSIYVSLSARLSARLASSSSCLGTIALAKCVGPRLDSKV